MCQSLLNLESKAPFIRNRYFFSQFWSLLNSSNSSSTLYEHRTAKKSQIFSSAYLAAVHLSREKSRNKVFCFGSPAMREELASLGVDHFGLVFGV